MAFAENKIDVLKKIKDSKYLYDGCSVLINGVLVKSPEEATQLFEVKITKLQ